MSETQENISKQFQSCHVRGESVPLWIPAVMALLGLVNSVFIAQALWTGPLPMADSSEQQGRLHGPAGTELQRRTKTQANVAKAGPSTVVSTQPAIPKKSANNEKPVQRLPAIATNTATQTKPHPVQDTLPGPLRSVPQAAVNPVPSHLAAIPSPPASVQQHQNASALPQAARVLAKPSVADGRIAAKSTEPANKVPNKPAEPVATAPRSSKDIARSPQMQSPASNTAATMPRPAAVRQITQPKNCPALFFIAFPIGSEIPQSQNISPKIRRLRSWLRQHPDKKVIIEGHTDSYGPEEYNLLLSYRRAKAAEKILLKGGLAKKQLLVRALGEEQPVPGLPAKSRKNRVASIKVENLEECINNLINGDID